MKKNNDYGFMLAETLIVTAFVAGVLIFLYFQFSKLSASFNEAYIYNTVEGLYALEDIKEYIESDKQFLEYVTDNIDSLKYIDISNCSNFTESDYCSELLKLEKVKQIFITTNEVPSEYIDSSDKGFDTFINKIGKEGKELYRIVAAFENSSYATIRFGELYE